MEQVHSIFEYNKNDNNKRNVIMSTGDEQEKEAYEAHMRAEGYIKVNGEWKLAKYPEKDLKSYKEALPTKG